MSAPLPLGSAFLGRLDAARDLAWLFFRGERPSGATGAPPEEFEGYRPYLPGDDIRWIDWNLYARQEELFVKVFRAEEEVEALVMVDASASMRGDGGAKLRAASATAAALAYLALRTGHPVRVARYGDRLLDILGPVREHGAFGQVQQFLMGDPPPASGTDLAQSLQALSAASRRPVILVVVTDGFQRAPLPAAATVAFARGVRRFALVRVADPADLAPRLRGHLLLADPEGGAGRHLFADRAFEQACLERIAGHLAQLREGLRRLGAATVELATDRGFEEAFLAMIRSTLPAAGGAAPAP